MAMKAPTYGSFFYFVVLVIFKKSNYTPLGVL